LKTGYDRFHRLLPVIILILGAALRFHALSHDARLHPDEALFATFARKAAVNGDWLLRGPLDKTPLSIYAQALSMMLVGVQSLPDGVLALDVHIGEFAARLPGTLASILLLAVIYALAKRPYGDPTALIALFLAACSPYLLAFSATAFTDGLMLLCITLALWGASRGRWWWAGVWLALGFACKQQALLYVPLVVGLAYLTPRPPLHLMERGRFSHVKPLATGWRGVGGEVLRFALPLLAIFALLAAWDAARAQESSLWALAVANNQPAGLIQPDEALPSLQTWARYAGHFFGPAWLTALLLGVGLFGCARRVIVASHDRRTRIDVILLVYCLGYFLLHGLVALPTHDRYLLPLLPPLILLVARGLNQIRKSVSQRHRGTEDQRGIVFSVSLFLCISALLFFPAAFDAAEGRVDVGGDRGEHDGIDRLGAYLEGKPLGTIIYDHWLGWELGYYLGTWSNKRLTYYPTAGALAADAAAQPDPAPRYLPAPAYTAVQPWLSALAARGFKIFEDYRSTKFVVYRLVPP